MKKILFGLICSFSLPPSAVQAQRTIRLYNFFAGSERSIFVFKEDWQRLVPYFVELPSKQVFSLPGSGSIMAPNGFAVTNFDSAIVLKIRFVDFIVERRERSIFGAGDRCFDTSLVLHPDSIGYNDIDLYVNVELGRAWLEPRDATLNKFNWRRSKRLRKIVTYDLHKNWATVHKWGSMTNTINFDCNQR